MRIFINALSARLGGGQTYLLNLLKHVPQNEGLEVYVLVQPSFQLEDLPSNVTRLEQASLENPFFRAVWEETRMISLLKKLKIDLFFSPGGLLPKTLPSNILTAVTFQNMLPFDLVQRRKYSYGYRRLRDFLLKRGLSESMCRANLIIFISEFARKFINHELGFLDKKSIVAPHGIHPSFMVDYNSIPLRPSWLPKEDYFLYVSFIDHYKAQLEIVRGFNLYCQQGGTNKLVLVGAEYRPYGDLVRKEIADLGLSEMVFMTGNVPHQELSAAYQNAKINVFASYTENCPNILLEMMASGRPALVSRYEPMPEFGGDTVVYFDPSSPNDFAENLVALANDESRQLSFAKQALNLVASHTWERSAEITWHALMQKIA